MLARTFAKPKEMVRAEFRVRHANGSWRTIEAVCQNFLDDPRIGGIIGNYRDITERKAVEELAENERKKILTILASTNEGIYGVDADGMCTFINPALLKLLGYKEKDCLGKSLHVLTHNRHLDGSEYKLTDCPVYRAVTSGNPVRLAEDVLWTKNNEPVYVLLSCSPMKEDRIITGGVITVIDIRERKKLERQKDEFIGIASHELKTPVTSIKAYAQVLENRFTKAGDERSASLLAKMDTQLNKLTNLIKDLLDVTKIETGELQLREETFDFNTLVSEIVEEMQRTTEKHKIVKKLGQTKNVRGDRDRIGQVLINFLSNAIKYSPDSDTIQVKTTSDTKSISAAVTDYGLGIDKTDQLKIFERFFRGSTQEKASYPGLGLGLYISAEIVRRHKGKIWVQSTKSQGATFSFSLPIK
jgi:PAS domain S-box-containing protein